MLLRTFLSLFFQGNIFINFSAFFEIDFLPSSTKKFRSFIISRSLISNRSRWFLIKFKDWLMTIKSSSFRKYLKQISTDWVFSFSSSWSKSSSKIWIVVYFAEGWSILATSLINLCFHLLNNSGYPNIKIEKKIDFYELYKSKAN